MIRVLVADDQADMRHGYRMVIDAQPDMTVIGEAADGEAAVALARHLRPDVVIADVRMPKLTGLQVTAALAGPGADPAHRVVVVTTFQVDDHALAALRNGACGFLLKRSGPTLLIEAVRAAMAGDVLISPELTMRLFRRLAPAGGTADAPTDAAASLTAREEQVANLVAEGLPNAEIADRMHLAVGTVKNLVAVVARKLEVSNRVGIALRMWGRRGNPG